MEQEIVMIKTIIGEEIIGKLKGINDRGIDIIDPLMIKYRYSEDGRPSVYFTKYPFYTKSFEAYFKMEGVMHVYHDVLETVSRYYERNLIGIKEAYEHEEQMRNQQLFDDYEDEYVSESEIEEQMHAFIERMSSNTAIH